MTLRCKITKIIKTIYEFRKWSPQGNCPYCHQKIDMLKLDKIPFLGKLKWYQFTPTDEQACPQCHGLLANTLVNSPWLLVMGIPLIILILSKYFTPEIGKLAELFFQFGIVVWCGFCLFKACSTMKLIKKESPSKEIH